MLERLARALRQHIREAHVRHAEGVHDLRVTCRRLETVLRLWSRRGDARPLRRRVQAIRRAAGTARASEVLAAALRAGELGAAVLPVRLRRRWATRLEREHPREPLPAVQAVDRVATLVERWACGPALRSAREERARRRLRMWRRLGRVRAETAIEHGEASALHTARLAIERWRYAEEAVGSGATARVREARRWQRVLGALNDRVALATFVAAQGPEGEPYVALLERRRQASLRSLRRRLASRGSKRRAR
jgi:CHAD domain-containing protein